MNSRLKPKVQIDFIDILKVQRQSSMDSDFQYVKIISYQKKAKLD